MTVWSWLKLTVCLWLLRKAVKAAGWLLLAALAVARGRSPSWRRPGTLAAWLRGWPPARLCRAAAWSLPMTAVYCHRRGGAASAPGRPSRWPRCEDWAARLAATWPPSAVRAGRSAGRPGRDPGRAGAGRRCCGRGGSTPSPPGSAGGSPPRRSPSTPASGGARSAPPAAGPPRPAPSRS